MSAAQQLLARLDAAPDDDSRTAIVASCTAEQLEQLHAALAYRQFAAAPDPFSDFTAALDGAASDEERLQLIAAADPVFLSEWSWRRGADQVAWYRRYATACGCEAAP